MTVEVERLSFRGRIMRITRIVSHRKLAGADEILGNDLSLPQSVSFYGRYFPLASLDRARQNRPDESMFPRSASTHPGLGRFYLSLIADFWGRILVRRLSGHEPKDYLPALPDTF